MDVGETPFLVAVDFEWRTVVVSIRGTLSLKVRQLTFDILTLIKYLSRIVLVILCTLEPKKICLKNLLLKNLLQFVQGCTKRTSGCVNMG